jgi:hypothetical protein
MTFEERIYEAAKKIVPENIALLMVAQAKHETGNFTSSVFKTNNNCFGYKYFKGSKYQLQKGKLSPEGNSYAAYANIEDSTTEVAKWILRHVPDNKNIFKPEDYAIALKDAGYFGDTVENYAHGLKEFFQSTIT